MRFEVPQFIEIEDKIFGPFTLKQFIYLAGAGGLSFMIFRVLPNTFGFILMAPVIVFGLALAFYRYHNRPFINILESAFNYYTRSKLFTWRKSQRPQTEAGDDFGLEQNPHMPVYVPKLSDSKLRDISWSLDITERDRGEVL